MAAVYSFHGYVVTETVVAVELEQLKKVVGEKVAAREHKEQWKLDGRNAMSCSVSSGSMVKFARTLASYIAIFKYTPEMHLSIIYILFIILVRA